MAKLARVSRRLLGLPSAPKLSDMLLRPQWHEHPLSSRFGRGKAWYVLFIPTFGEGHEVLSEVRRALDLEQADITVVVAFFAVDPTRPDILQAEQNDPRVVALSIEATADGDFALMQRSFHSRLHALIEERGWPPQDVITLTVPELQSRQRVLRV